MLYVLDDVSGVTYLDNIMYVVCYKSSTIRLYNTDTLSRLRVVINVKGMILPCDIVVCRHDRQLYVADEACCIWRVSVDDHSYVKWLTVISVHMHIPRLHAVNDVTASPRDVIMAVSCCTSIQYDEQRTVVCRTIVAVRGGSVSRS